MLNGDGEVGYGKPPRSTQFAKGRSGNPKGRPRNKHRQISYDVVLGQMVTIREDGRERRVTAAEAFVLQLTKRGLQGDSAAARASLTAIESARASKNQIELQPVAFNISYVEPGSVGCALRALGMADKIHKASQNAQFRLRPWIVQAAIDRLGDKRLSADEQKVVVAATKKPELVQWPDWWSCR